MRLDDLKQAASDWLDDWFGNFDASCYYCGESIIEEHENGFSIYAGIHPKPSCKPTEDFVTDHMNFEGIE